MNTPAPPILMRIAHCRRPHSQRRCQVCGDGNVVADRRSRLARVHWVEASCASIQEEKGRWQRFVLNDGATGMIVRVVTFFFFSFAFSLLYP